MWRALRVGVLAASRTRCASSRLRDARSAAA
jgi:hypothetical protein